VDHPTTVELESLVVGSLSAEQRRSVITHLVRGCPRCGGIVAQFLPVLVGRASRTAPPPPAEETYDGALNRAVANIRLLAAKPVAQTVPEAVDFLAARGVAGLEDVPISLLDVPLYEALLERSWTLRYEDPGPAVELARCAAQLADGFSTGEHDSRKLADLRCRAAFELANTYRVADELDLADSTLQRATKLFLRGTKDELLGARLFDVQASLYAARRQFDLACTALDIAADTYRRRGDEHLAGRALISKGIYTGYKGASEEAVRLIGEGLSSLDSARDPGLAFSSLQTKAWLLVDCGRFLEARTALFELNEREMGGRVNELKVRWLEGRLAAGLEEMDEAESALRQVKEAFEELGLGYKAALVGLELGAVWLRQNRLEAAAAMALDCSDAFLALGIQRELVASILILRKAAETRALTVSLLYQVIDTLQAGERALPASGLQPSRRGAGL